ncbi:MAG: MBL fold metallo-hydrolase [Dehalococcoidales bacterium]|nr:MBL fold metallo-hydrolase [Dehalococcoidales bacterium]
MIINVLAVGPFSSNCYIIGAEASREGMIIDPGDEAPVILKKVAGLKLDIKSIVLTHGHIDHIGALKEIKEATGAEVCLHPADVSIFQDNSINTMFGLNYPAPPSPDRLLQGGDNIDVGDLRFLVLHTPGHSPGSICLLSPGVVFTGDTLFNYGIGRTDFTGGSFPQLMDSIHTKLMVLPDDTVVYPGHGPASTIGAERQGNSFLHG